MLLRTSSRSLTLEIECKFEFEFEAPLLGGGEASGSPPGWPIARPSAQSNGIGPILWAGQTSELQAEAPKARTSERAAEEWRNKGSISCRLLWPFCWPVHPNCAPSGRLQARGMQTSRPSGKLASQQASQQDATVRCSPSLESRRPSLSSICAPFFVLNFRPAGQFVAQIEVQLLLIARRGATGGQAQQVHVDIVVKLIIKRWPSWAGLVLFLFVVVGMAPRLSSRVGRAKRREQKAERRKEKAASRERLCVRLSAPS